MPRRSLGIIKVLGCRIDNIGPVPRGGGTYIGLFGGALGVG
ncbi:MAG: hypothetical protein R2912_06060 [Eubacteriales bacterium]